MGITGKLSEWYSLAEEKFYKIFDWLELKGLPIYNYNDFLETKGIPVFPFTIALIAIIAVLGFWFFAINTSLEPTLSLSIKDTSGNALSTVNVSVWLNGQKILEEAKSNAGEIKLSRLPIGAKIEVQGTKTGYETGIATATVNAEKVPVELELAKIVTPITGLLQIVDETTGTPIKGALVTASWGKDNVRQATTDANGIVKLDGIPQGEKITVTVKADNFEDVQELLSFENLQTQTLSVPEKATAMFGSANLLITVFDNETNSTLDSVSIKIFDSRNDSLLFEGITQDGQYLAQLPKGTSVHITATKEKYIKFDSTEPLTISQDEETLEVFLEKGGQKIKVTAKQKDSLLPALGATISLYNSTGALLDSNKAGFSGTVEFSNLDPDANYFVAAFLEGYNGEAKIVNPGTTSEVDLALELATEENSASLNSYVFAANGDAANDASLNFFEIKDDALYPVGAPSLKTAYDGFATIKMPVGKNILVTATKGVEYGDANKIIIAMTENAVQLNMRLASTVKTILVYTDENFLLETGYAEITSATDESLFDGDFFNGAIVFDAKANKTANVSITTTDGNAFSEQITIPDSDAAIELHLGKENNNELAPQIEFLGIIDSEGKTVNSLTPGGEYWLKFETSWIKGFYNGGIHVRVGNDEVKFADSEDVGIVGYSAAGADALFGRTWNAFPAPGNEGIDLRNAGKPGAMNKWLELYYDNPQGVKVIKVKVRVRENATVQSIALHYRAWSVVGTNYERNPLDSELGKEKFVDSKTGLYAETIETELPLFGAQPECEKDICVSYNFVLENGAVIPTTDFQAIKDKVFALEATIKSKKTVGALIKANTQTDKPKLFFTGVEVESFTEFIDNNSTQPSIEVNELSLVENAERRVRFYFKPRFTGNASIKLQLIADETVINNEFFFNIFEERLMTATLLPETVNVGVDFTVLLKDAAGKGVEKATLHLKDASNSIVASTIGDGTSNNGANGAYFFKNTFSAGTYSLQITAQTFSPIAMELPIGSTDTMIVAPEELTINIAKGEITGTGFLQLQNNAATDIQNIEFQFDKTASFPLEVELTATIPTALKKGAKTRIDISAMYSGDINASSHAEADLIIIGSVAGRFPTRTKAHVIIEYNKRLDSGCLEFDKESISMFLSGEEGGQSEETIQVKNNCEMPLTFEARAEPKTNSTDEQLVVQVEGFSVDPGKSTTINVTAINTILRRYATKENREFDLIFTAPQLEKHLALTVTLWDKAYAVGVRDSIVLWLSQSTKGEPVVASTPLFIQNIGEADIEDLSIDVAEANWEGVTVRIAPAGSATGQTLKKGANLLPTRIVVAELKGGTAKGKLVQGFLTIKGSINGRQVELRRINVWIHISALNCLKAYPVTDLEFESTATGIGVIDKKIAVRNTCEEAVRVVDVDPNKVGANDLAIVPLATDLLDTDAEAEFLLRMTKGYDYKADNVGIAVIGLTMLTHKFIQSDRLNARIALGEKEVETGLASAPFKVNVCNPDGTIAKEKKDVRFPIIAKTPDCAKAYCDAELAAEYIGKKITEKISLVQSAVDRGNGEIANFPGCAGARACSFNRMGVKSGNFDLYLSNDSITDMLLKKVLTEKVSGLRNYSVSYCSSAQCENVEAIAATGFPNLMYLTDFLRGCGRYKIEINGAVFAAGSKIEESGYTIVVRVSSKQTTPECTNKITNAMNFLPQDAGLTEASSNGAWPGSIEAKTELEETGKTIAKELFGKEDRYSSSASGNKMRLDLGELKTGIVKLEMLQTGTAAEPKTINATINQALGTGKETVQKEIAKEAANAIASLKTQRLEEGKSCVSADDSFMVIGSYTKFGAITIDGPSELKMKQGKTDLSQQAMQGHSCVDMVVVSKIAEEVYIKTNASEIENSPYGIAKVYARAKQKNSGNFSALSETSIAKLEKDEKTNEYKFGFQLCAVGSTQMSLAKKGIELKVWAENRFDPLRKVDPAKIVKAIPCATHPYDLMNEIDTKAPGEYYTTVGWKGEPDKIKLSDLVNKMQQDKAFEEARTNIGQNIKLGDAFTEKDKSNRLNAIALGYFPACAATTVGLDLATMIRGWSAAFDVFFNCAMPAGWAMMDLGESTAKIKEFLVSNIPLIGRFTGVDMDKIESGEAQETGAEDLFKSGLTFGAARAGVAAIDRSQYVSMLQVPGLGKKGIKAIANDMKTKVVAKMKENLGENALPSSRWTTIGNDLQSSFEKSLEKGMAKLPPGKILPDPGKTYEEIIQTTIDNGYKKVFPAGEITDDMVKEMVAQHKAAAAAGTPSPYSTALQARLPNSDMVTELTKSDFINKFSGSIEYRAKDAAKNAIDQKNLVKNMEAYYKNLFGGKLPKGAHALVKKEVDGIMKSGGLSDLRKVKIDSGKLEILHKQIMNIANSDPAFKTSYESAVATVEKSTLRKAQDLAKEGVEYHVPTSRRLASFGLNLLKGVVISAIANLAGIAGFEIKMNVNVKDIGPSRQFVPPVGALAEQKDTDIENGETYKIKITEAKDAKGQSHKSFEITQVKDLSEIPEKANWISLDCEGKWAEKGLEAATDYSPDQEKITATFGKDWATILSVGYHGFAVKIKSAAEANKLPQDQLLAILTADAMARYSNLQPNDCGKWLEANTKTDGEAAIDCIAAKMKQAFKENNASGTFSQYFTGLGEKNRQLALDNALKAQGLWQSMKAKKATLSS